MKIEAVEKFGYIVGHYVRAGFDAQAVVQTLGLKTRYCRQEGDSSLMPSLHEVNALSEVTKTWSSNGSCQMVIPKDLALKHRLMNSNVVISETKDGLLLKKLELE